MKFDRGNKKIIENYALKRANSFTNFDLSLNKKCTIDEAVSESEISFLWSVNDIPTSSRFRTPYGRSEHSQSDDNGLEKPKTL